jgi:hypothetical protein
VISRFINSWGTVVRTAFDWSYTSAAMKPLWCWRCKIEGPMLDDDEYKLVTSKHETKGTGGKAEIRERFFGPVLREYERITGFREMNPNAVYHHRLSLYGPPCARCQKTTEDFIGGRRPQTGKGGAGRHTFVVQGSVYGCDSLNRAILSVPHLEKSGRGKEFDSGEAVLFPLAKINCGHSR